MERQIARKYNYDTGLLDLDPAQNEFLDWLCGEREEGDSEDIIAARLGCNRETLRRWKRDDSFLRLWQSRMVKTHANPALLSKQLRALNKKAEQGDVKAIELYWKLVDRMKPPELVLSTTSQVAGMTDEALSLALTRAADAAVARAKIETPKEQADRVRAELGMGAR